MKWYNGKLDQWSGYHFLMGYFIGNLLQQGLHFGLLGIILAFAFCCLFEAFESIFWFLGRFHYPAWFPIYAGCEIVDPQGGCWNDVIVGGIGCIAALFI